MTEITRVPLQPIAKGALGKLWLGVVAALLIASGIAWAVMPSAVKVETVKEGIGANPTDDDVVFARYKGKLSDGKVFDESHEAQLPINGLFPAGSPLPLAGVIPGMRDGLKQTQKGGKYVIEIPGDLAYGPNPPPGAPIPPNADLVFDIEVVAIMPRAEFEQRVQMIQQMMQMQQQGGAPGAPGAAPPAPPQP